MSDRNARLAIPGTRIAPLSAWLQSCRRRLGLEAVAARGASRPQVEALEKREVLDAGLGVVGKNAPFLEKLYHDLLQRAPEAEEVAAWSAAQDNGLGREQVALGFLHSVEYRTREVGEGYWALLGRAPEEGAAERWVNQLGGSFSHEELTANLLASDEYVGRQGGSVTQWLQGLYRDALGRAADAEGLAGWEARAQGASRVDVARGFVDGAEARGLSLQVTYPRLLHRRPESSDLWAGRDRDGLIAGIASSAEYAAFATGTTSGDDAGSADVRNLVVQIRPGTRGALEALAPYAAAQGFTFEATPVEGLYELQGTVADEARAFLGNRPYVAFVEAQQELSVQLTPSDPSYVNGNLWGLSGTWGVNAPRAWDSTTGSARVVIADIDTGVDYNHVDLYKNMWINQGEIPAATRSALADLDGDGVITFWDLNDARNQGAGKIRDVNGDGRVSGTDLLAPVSSGGWADGVSNDGDGYRDDLIGWNFVANNNNPMDDNNHGTHTAGTIAGMANNGTGVAGVNWKAQIMPLKFLGSNGSGSTTAAAAAVRYAADHGARASNNSWGGSGSTQSLFDAIAYAGNKGHVFVAAAGNNGRNTDGSPNYPSGYNLSNIIAVASITSSGARSSFSNYGKVSVDLGAPGSGIVSTVRGGGYASFSGTSMATPHVAGVVGLVLSQNPTWTATQVVNKVLTSTRPSSSMAGITVTGGLADAALAVTPPTDLNWTGGGVTFPAALSTDAPFTVQRTYNITPLNAASNFTINYYASSDATLGNADDILFGTETVSAAADKSVGLHTGTSASLRLLRTGPYYLFAKLDGGDALGETDEGNNAFRSAQPLAVTGNLNVLDDAEGGFATTGSWTPFGGQGYQNDVTFAAAGTGVAQATWSATGLTPGRYRVSATWSTHANRATNAPFTVLDGTVPLATAAVNQELAPNDLSDQGVAWEDLGTVTVSGTTLVVRLSNAANEYVIADAVRLERVGELPAGPEVQVLDGATDIPDNTGVVDFGSTFAGVPVTKTFTVKNLGNTNLILGSAVSLPAGFTLATGFGSTTLAPGASTTLGIRFDGAGAGQTSGEVSFATNDGNEDPFNFSVRGRVVTTKILDDGATGFSTSGSWTPFVGQGYQNDVTFAAAGTGTSAATWSFTDLTPGRYRVSATWSTHANRATNAPFTILDGATTLATVAVNQELAPNDLSDQGVAWEDLGTVNLTGTTLVVRLTNLANEYVIADGVRIEKVG